MIVTTTDYGTV